MADERGNRGTAAPGQTDRGRKERWKPKTSAQKARKGQTRSMSDRVCRIDRQLRLYPQDPLAWAVGFLNNTGRSTQIHAMAHGRAGALSDTTLQHLRTLMTGLLSVFEAKRELAATRCFRRAISYPFEDSLPEGWHEDRG